MLTRSRPQAERPDPSNLNVRKTEIHLPLRSASYTQSKNQTLHWQAIGNPRCQGTWKKVRRVEQCSCPAVHSFIFI
ncbi:hypothetical protein E2I00_003581 [Balaenoptera physalus]|uniref:SBSPON-like C-terminal domain-containing protein n=1 Tax=Balaenoptera physalus TaxID=9770 RepID=A0A643CFU4_BALPH|nr:hypothetical protein E2I00_003581 [Balaenoptera physalus]